MDRVATPSHPQLVCILADNSISMKGPKAEAATAGIREMIMECQALGPGGVESSCFYVVVIRFAGNAEVVCKGPVRTINTDAICLRGEGVQTDITGALNAGFEVIRSYLDQIAQTGRPGQSPLPLVILFSDGQHNGPDDPGGAAARIKGLRDGGDPVLICTAGVSVEGGDQPDVAMLKRIATSPECYLHIRDVELLTQFIADVGSRSISRRTDLEQIVSSYRRLSNQG